MLIYEVDSYSINQWTLVWAIFQGKGFYHLIEKLESVIRVKEQNCDWLDIIKDIM